MYPSVLDTSLTWGGYHDTDALVSLFLNNAKMTCFLGKSWLETFSITPGYVQPHFLILR